MLSFITPFSHLPDPSSPQNEWGQTHAPTFVNNHAAIAAIDCTLKLCNELTTAIPGYNVFKDGYLTKLRDLHSKVERAQAVRLSKNFLLFFYCV